MSTETELMASSGLSLREEQRFARAIEQVERSKDFPHLLRSDILDLLRLGRESLRMESLRLDSLLREHDKAITEALQALQDQQS